MRFELVEGNEEEKTMVGDSYDNRGMVEDLVSEVCEKMEGDDDIIDGSLSKQPRDEIQGGLLTLEVDENDGNKFDRIGAPLEVTNVAVFESRGLQNIGEDELVRETRGVIETFSVEGKPHNPVVEEKMRPEGLHEAADEMQGILLTLEVDENDGNKFNQTGPSLEVTNVVVLESRGLQNIEEDELVRENRGLIETFSVEGKPHNPVLEGKMQPEGVHGAADEMNIPVEAKNNGKKGKRKGRKKEKAEGKRIETLPRETDVHKVQQSRNAHPDQDKEVAGLVVEDKKPIREESEKMIADYGKEKANTKLDVGRLRQRTSKGNVLENSLDIGDAKIPKSLALSGLKDGRGISPSFIEDQEIYGEEKLWQQIEAMRKIVGYKAKLQASCIEELKSLYTFTGVKPPDSFKDTSDLVEVNKKLRFLMSVVGVK
ncbi:hypothetical protein BT93_H1037 [Corymbia citriodora subsp. variegata]|nr:hypothetical protein BT93_H1037 [Corymbia citriodora subsp. variegata]